MLNTRRAVAQRLDDAVAAEEEATGMRLADVIQSVAHLKATVESLAEMVCDELQNTSAQLRSQGTMLDDLSYKVQILLSRDDTPPPPPPPKDNAALLSRKALQSSNSLRNVIATVIKENESVSKRIAAVEAAQRLSHEDSAKRIDETETIVLGLQRAMACVKQLQEEQERQSETLLTQRLETMAERSQGAVEERQGGQDHHTAVQFEHNFASLEHRVSSLQAASVGIVSDLQSVKMALSVQEKRTGVLHSISQGVADKADEAFGYAKDTRRATRRSLEGLAESLNVSCPSMPLVG